MSDPFVGEIRIFAFNFTPVGWASCNGQELAISGNDVLFALIGTTYGGDGVNTFALPDLRNRMPAGVGSGPGLQQRTLGETYGTESVTLTASQMPAHNHVLTALIGRAAPHAAAPTTGNALGAYVGPSPYTTDAATATMNQAAVSPVGGSLPHDNVQPILAMNPCIATQGIFPT